MSPEMIGFHAAMATFFALFAIRAIHQDDDPAAVISIIAAATNVGFTVSAFVAAVT